MSYTVPSAEVASMPVGASSPAQAAMMTRKDSTSYQSSLIGAGKKKRGGGVAIYQPTVPYTESSAGSQSIGSINSTITQSGMQQQASSVYDGNATKGGRRRRRSTSRSRRMSKKRTAKKARKRGGKLWKEWETWGCYSGGGKTKRRRIQRKRLKR